MLATIPCNQGYVYSQALESYLVAALATDLATGLAMRPNTGASCPGQNLRDVCGGDLAQLATNAKTASKRLRHPAAISIAWSYFI